MDDWTRALPLALILAVVLHRILLQFVMVGPAKYQECVTLRAARGAFVESNLAESDKLLPYHYRVNWRRLFNVYDLRLHRNAPALFKNLRELWGLSEAEYEEETRGGWSSFGAASGLSGSLFFISQNKAYLMKSLGRAFENRFLHEHFLPAYFDYAHNHPDTLINKVLDVLCSFDHRLGEWLKCSPSHFLVLENIARDVPQDWEIFDLKPTTYLEPFRDLLPAGVQGSAVTDVLPGDKPLLVASVDARAETLRRISEDAHFLAALGAIDWSVLVVRPPDGTGFRLAIIDVFWSLRTPRAQLTKQLSDAAGVPAQTVTADADGYAREIVKMMGLAIRVQPGWC